jgi:hypothetical protein
MAHDFTDPTPQTLAYLAELMAEMRELRWVRGHSHVAFARRHGMSEDNARRLSAEAWRRVAAEVNNASLVAGTVGTALARVIQDALADGDRKSIVDASKVWASVAGLAAKVEVTGKDGGPIETTSPRDALLERLAGLAGRRAPSGGASEPDRDPE